MNIIKELTSFGLRPNETEIYLLILDKGLITPPQIARATKIARPNVYSHLETLCEKGLIEIQTKGKRKAYQAKNPDALLYTLERKKENIKKILPELSGLYSTPKNKPQVRYYSGPKEIEEIYLMILNCWEKSVYAYGGTQSVPKIMQNFWAKTWLPQIKKQNIMFKDTSFASSAKTLADIKQAWGGLHDDRIIPAHYGETPTGLILWDNNIALMNYEEPIFGTVITNDNLAKALKICYEVLWDSLSIKY